MANQLRADYLKILSDMIKNFNTARVDGPLRLTQRSSSSSRSSHCAPTCIQRGYIIYLIQVNESAAQKIPKIKLNSKKKK